MDLPARVQSLGSLSFGSWGTSIFAAAAASEPKLALRPLPAWLTRLLAALHSAAGTPQFFAAAATSISRAAAPPLRRYSWEERMVWLPVEFMAPQARLPTALSCAETYS